MKSSSARTMPPQSERTQPGYRRFAPLGLIAVAILAGCSVGGSSEGDTNAAGEGDTNGAAGGAATTAAPKYARYVALGDSFAALGPLDAPTSGPPTCFRSAKNYPAFLAENPSVGEFTDATCGGATTKGLADRQIPATPPQLQALTPDTALVTLSMGGNDIGYGSIVECLSTTARSSGAPCRDRLELQVTSALDALSGDLDAAYAGIKERAPQARIISTRYLPLAPSDGGCEYLSRISPGDITWVRQVVDRLDRVVVSAAERAGSTAVLPADAAQRTACAPASERYTDFDGQETRSHPMHPTEAGQRAMAAAIGEVL